LEHVFWNFKRGFFLIEREPAILSIISASILGLNDKINNCNDSNLFPHEKPTVLSFLFDARDYCREHHG
jgi:hypothetical protein